MTVSKGSRWIPLLLVLATVLAMGRLCAADFTWWDDDKTVHHNPRLNPPTAETVEYYWTHPAMSLYVPVTYTVWTALAVIAHVDQPDARGISLNPWVFHTANLLVHVLTVLVLYRFLRLIVKRDWAAPAGALMFAVHPVQVEAVGWISGMKDLLGGLFAILALWQYLLFARATKTNKTHYWLGLLCMVLGTLCKPGTVVIPLLAIAVDRFVVGRNWQEIAKSIWPWMLAAIPCLIWTKIVQEATPTGAFWHRPLVALDAVAFYLGKILWPDELAVDYGRNPTYVFSTGQAYWTWVVPVALGIALCISRKRRPTLVAAFVIFIAGMLPMLGLTPFQFQSYSTVADHYLYLPMVGVAIAAAWCVDRWASRKIAVVAGILIALMAGKSIVQAGIWADDFTLNQHTLAVNPRSHSAEYNLGIAFEFQARIENNQQLRDEAIAHLRRAMEIKPGHVRARSSLATILIARGRKEEAMRLLQEAVRLGEKLPRESRSEAAPAHFALGVEYEKDRQWREAASEFRKALELQPEAKPIRAALGRAEKHAGGLEGDAGSSKVGTP